MDQYNNEGIIDEMWNDRNSGGICMICPECGGSSAAFCSCAYQRFKDSVSHRDIEKYRRERHTKDLEKKQGELARKISEVEKLQDEIEDMEKKYV